MIYHCNFEYSFLRCCFSDACSSSSSSSGLISNAFRIRDEDVDVDVDVSVDVDVEWVDGVEWVPNSGQWKRHFADVPGAPMDRRSDGVDG